MVFRYLPRHSVEARGMSVEASGRFGVARGVSAVVRRMPWRSVDTAVVLREKDKCYIPQVGHS